MGGRGLVFRKLHMTHVWLGWSHRDLTPSSWDCWLLQGMAVSAVMACQLPVRRHHDAPGMLGQTDVQILCVLSTRHCSC